MSMAMSVEVPNASEPLKFLKMRKEEIPSVSLNSREEFVSSDSVVDLSKINFEDDLTWLNDGTNSKQPQSRKLSLSEVRRFLYEDSSSSIGLIRDLEATKTTPTLETEKSFDSRTFTRPKKNENRPSIEKLTGEYFGNISGRTQSSPRRISTGTGLLDTTHTILKEDAPPQVQSPFRRKSMEKIDSLSLREEVTDTDNATHTQPLKFDLTNQTSSYYFESILANNSADADSFQNMSPPSLVNSMCSSTFTNLMENSYIKNDPELREIRDTDFTESVLMQEAEPPFCQSMSESCSSLNSDSPENFLRKVSMNGSFKRSLIKNPDRSSVNNETSLQSYLELEDLNDSTLILDDVDVDAILNNTSTSTNTNTGKDETLKSTPTSKLNGTYRRPSKYATYRKSDSCRNSPNLESAFISPSYSPSKDSDKSKDGLSSSTERDDYNTIVTVESPRLKRRFERSQMQIKEMLEKSNDNTTNSQNNKISELNKLNTTRSALNATFDKTYRSFTKASSFDSMADSFEEPDKLNPTFCKPSEAPVMMACSSGSVESLDRLSSSLSNTSLSSSRVLYDADGSEIQTTQNFNAMSTPRPAPLQTKLWDNEAISPITSNSCDTDQSSSDEFQSARSNLSKKTLVEEDFNDETYVAQKRAPGQPRGVNAVPRNLASMAMAFRSSYTSLQKVGANPYGSQPSLDRAAGNSKPSNLKTVKSTLRGSYTSLRPISAGSLPVAPPISKHNSIGTANTRPMNSKSASSVAQICSSNARISEISQFSRTKACGNGDGTFVVPNPPRTSGLPRPVGTGIPRPLSRIPGPRTSRSSSALQKKTTGGYY